MDHAREPDHPGAPGRAGERRRRSAPEQTQREAGYGGAAWRVVGGLRVAVGRYRLSFARDAGVNDTGAAYRVGLEARLR